MIVDCHVHPQLVRDDANHNDKEMAQLLDCMERVGIGRVCLTPMVMGKRTEGFFPHKDSVVFAAEFLTETVKKAPDRFFSMLWVNLHHGREFAMDLVKKYIMYGRINGVKLWTEMNAADDRLDAFAGFLEEHDIPVLFHCFYNTLGKTFKESNPAEIAILARRHPGLRIVMAHLRGCGYRGVQDIKALPNVSIDTSGSGSEDGYLEYALRELGPDRILFGSDYPGRDFAAQMARIDTLEMDQETKDKLFQKNAIDFFGRPHR